MNRAERIFRLHHLLKGGKPLSFEKLQEELAMSRARHIGNLQQMHHSPTRPSAD